jgi:predicted NAD/FAD-dependent oxidoreductase
LNAGIAGLLAAIALSTAGYIVRWWYLERARGRSN